MTTTAYDHRDPAHLQLIAKEIMALDSRRLAKLNARVAASGLMQSPRWMEMVVRFGAWLRRESIETRWRVLCLAQPKVNLDARACLVHHLTNGTDSTDPTSAGGFNAVELGFIELRLMELGAYLPYPRKTA